MNREVNLEQEKTILQTVENLIQKTKPEQEILIETVDEKNKDLERETRQFENIEEPE